MKKCLLAILLAFSFLSARCDVIFFPRHYTLFSYSIEGVYSFEKIRNTKSTMMFWTGGGIVGSFLYLDEPAFGIEAAIERRRYFKPDSYKGFCFSGYLGVAIMKSTRYYSDLGIIPGLKLTHKSFLTPKVILEPYLSLSLPISFYLPDFNGYFPFPVLTVGCRVGIGKLKK